MPFSFLDHTADVRMLVRGNNLKDLFLSGLLGVVDFLKPEKEKNAKGIKRVVEIDSFDKTSLLIDFLNGCLFLMQSNYEFYSEANFEILEEKRLRAELKGLRAKSFKEEIKAITHHEAEIKESEDGLLETIIIFDI